MRPMHRVSPLNVREKHWKQRCFISWNDGLVSFNFRGKGLCQLFSWSKNNLLFSFFFFWFDALSAVAFEYHRNILCSLKSNSAGGSVIYQFKLAPLLYSQKHLLRTFLRCFLNISRDASIEKSAIQTWLQRSVCVFYFFFFWSPGYISLPHSVPLKLRPRLRTQSCITLSTLARSINGDNE